MTARASHTELQTRRIWKPVYLCGRNCNVICLLQMGMVYLVDFTKYVPSSHAVPQHALGATADPESEHT